MQSETGAVPADHSVRSDDCKCIIDLGKSRQTLPISAFPKISLHKFNIEQQHRPILDQPPADWIWDRDKDAPFVGVRRITFPGVIYFGEALFRAELRTFQSKER
jgi:hypothetical protein